MPAGFELQAHGSATTGQRWWTSYFTARFPDGSVVDVTHTTAPGVWFALDLRPANDRPVTDEQLTKLAVHFRVGPARARRLPVRPWYERTCGGPAAAALEQELQQELAAAADEEQTTWTRERFAAFLLEGAAAAVADDAEDIALGRRHLTVVYGGSGGSGHTDRRGALLGAVDQLCQHRQAPIGMLDTGEVLCFTVEGADAQPVIARLEQAALELGFRPDQLTRARTPRGRPI
jgi:hypothetical protein